MSSRTCLFLFQLYSRSTTGWEWQAVCWWNEDLFKFCKSWKHQVRLPGALPWNEPFFVRECWKLVVHNAKKRQSCGRWQYMESQMPRGGFDQRLEQILNGKHWPCPIHSQTGFRMISGSETRINLEPNPHFKPTHCCSTWNWQWGMCHSSSVWALCSSQTGAFSH